MATVWAVANGNWNTGATWNTGTVPTSADDVWANGFTVNMDVNATVNSLNNSARTRDIATPAMTANNTPSPYVAAASSTDGVFQPWRAFDRTTANAWQTPNGTTTGWLSMDFGTSIIIDAYTVFGSGTQSFNARNWTFEGSANNSTWTTLHTVTLPSAIGANSTYSSGSISNPTAYRYYRINVTLNGGAAQLNIPELELYRPGTAALASGGSFNFNTAGVTVTCTSTSASLSAGATNLITVTATTGTVTLNLGSNVTGPAIASSQLFNYTGACNFNLSGINFTSANAFSAPCINKSSTGTITITGNLFTGSVGTSTTNAIFSTNGNTIVIGNVTGGAVAPAINQSAGNVTVTGNVTGGTGSSIHGISLTGAASQFTINGNVTGGSGSSAHGINFTGASGVVTGNVIGGTSTGNGINTTGAVTVNGDVFGGGAAAGINTTSAITLTINGDVYASATAVGISSTNANGVVNLTGNMYNGLGRNAIYCQNVFISDTATTLWRVDTGGGDYKFLYSADTTPNLPPITDVRFGTTFGPALSLTGTMVVLANSDVRKDVPNDNSVGTAELTSADIISGINASSDPLAVRLKNALTDVTAGNIISQYKDS